MGRKKKKKTYFVIRLFVVVIKVIQYKYDSTLSDLERMQHYNTLKAEKYQLQAENI